MSNYLKSCPTRFPGAQSVSLTLNSVRGVEVSSHSSMGFSLRRGRWKCLCCSFGNVLAKCQFVVDSRLEHLIDSSQLLYEVDSIIILFIV